DDIEVVCASVARVCAHVAADAEDAAVRDVLGTLAPPREGRGRLDVRADGDTARAVRLAVCVAVPAAQSLRDLLLNFSDFAARLDLGLRDERGPVCDDLFDF